MSRSKDAWAYPPEHPLRLAAETPTTVVGLYAAATSRACVFDTETTGLGADARIVEISAAWVDLRTGLIERDEESRPRVRATLVDPGCAIPREATKIHGITSAMVRGKPALDAVLPAFVRFIGEGPVVAHNAPFDVRILRAESTRVGARLPSRVPVYCTKRLAKKVLPAGKSVALAAVAVECGVEQRKGAHRALADVETTGAVLAALIARAGKDLRELVNEEDRL